jgi:hypothetical protein
MKKKPKCRESRCSEPAYFDGRCERHYGEYKAKQQRRERVLAALHGTQPWAPQDPALREDWLRLLPWWNRICSAINANRLDPELGDETHAAMEWCIALAAELIDADQALRSGAKPGYVLEYARHWVWERFRNIEAGLGSNGTKRFK